MNFLFLQQHDQSQRVQIYKKRYKGINIYYIGYITIQKVDDCENIYSVNPLYLLVNHASGYIEEQNRNKYLVFDSTDGNKEVLKSTQNFGMRSKMNLKQ